jgi:hypothetical protein
MTQFAGIFPCGRVRAQRCFPGAKVQAPPRSVSAAAIGGCCKHSSSDGYPKDRASNGFADSAATGRPRQERLSNGFAHPAAAGRCWEELVSNCMMELPADRNWETGRNADPSA